jgi:CheY-like chemotaxis protein
VSGAGDPVVLCIDYDDAEDLIADYSETLSRGGTCVASSRVLAEGAPVHLLLSFPGLVAPILVEGLVSWVRAGDEPTIGIEFDAGASRDQLAATIARIRDRDPAVVKRAVSVVLVESNPHVAELIQHSLGDVARGALGPDVAATIRIASDEHEALALVRDTRVDVLIVDVYRPVVDGARRIGAVRSALGRRALPIIAVSAGGDVARTAALQAGADMFFDKPLRLSEVVQAIRALLSRGAE